MPVSPQEKKKRDVLLLYPISKSLLSSILLHFNTELNLLSKRKTLQSKLIFCVSDTAPNLLACLAFIYLFRVV